jgi:hypothetical protein
VEASSEVAPRDASLEAPGADGTSDAGAVGEAEAAIDASRGLDPQQDAADSANGTRDASDSGTSCVPKAADTCEPGNDDNCNGIPDEGCLCIVGTTRHCGICNDGNEACIDGKAGTYGACTGASAQQLFYRDADGDGHGDPNAAVTACAAPTGYVGSSDDCCDMVGGGADIYPGNTNWYPTGQTVCPGVKPFDYDCDNSETVEYDSDRYGDLVGNCGNYPSCSTGAGWAIGPPGPGIASCGVTARWVDCSTGAPGLHGCPFTDETMTQACH